MNPTTKIIYFLLPTNNGYAIKIRIIIDGKRGFKNAKTLTLCKG
jgi:hypothetical protein